MDLLSHPFRLERNGACATVTDGTADAYAESIAVLAMTRKNERTLCPRFGIVDPAFDRFSVGDLTLGIVDYGPPVEITGYSARFETDTVEAAVIDFEIAQKDL